jgi:hypothetical protein
MAESQKKNSVLGAKLESSQDVTVEFKDGALEGEPAEDPYAAAMAGGDTPPSGELVSWTRELVADLMGDDYESAVITVGKEVCEVEFYGGEATGEPDWTTYSWRGEF